MRIRIPEIRKRKITIKRSLMMRMVLLILLTSSSILAASYLQGLKQVSKTAPNNSIAAGIAATEEQLRTLLDQVNRNLLMARKWAQVRRFDIHDTEQLNGLFVPILEQYPQISSMQIAHPDGREWMLLKEGETYLNRLTDISKRGPAAHWIRWDGGGRMVKEWWRDIEYDPRDRPWYKGAAALTDVDAVHWTEPYAFFASNDPGMTVSTKFCLDGESPDRFCVMAFDVLLMDLSKFTTAITVSDHGLTLVITDSGRMIGLPRDDRFQSMETIRHAVLTHSTQLGIPPIARAIECWSEPDADREASFRFESSGGHWWAGFKPFTLGANQTLWIGVIVPESDFMGLLIAWRNSILVATLIVLFLTIWMAHALARRYSRPLEALAAESKRIRYRAAQLEAMDSADSRRNLGAWVKRSPFTGMGQSGIVEIDVMLSNIKDMANQLETKTKQTEMYSLSLERRVTERTEDLARKNRDLENTLLQLQEMQKQLVMQEKLASLGNLVAGVAHEVNNPTGAVNSAADVSLRCIEKLRRMLREAGAGDDISRSAEFSGLLNVLNENNQLIVSAGKRIANLVKGLKNFARLDEADLQTADVHEGLESTLLLVHHEFKNRIEIHKEYGSLPQITCYPNQLNQVFMNLFLNAVHAIEGNGTLTIKTESTGAAIRVIISDDGKGIPPQHLEKIFEPGFTTKGVGVGTGLGLPISYTIIQKHSGTLQVKSSVGVGTVFTITLPITGGDARRGSK
jgi:signal transduction histidine kinase